MVARKHIRAGLLAGFFALALGVAGAVMPAGGAPTSPPFGRLASR
jgi:hypothetical protein